MKIFSLIFILSTLNLCAQDEDEIIHAKTQGYNPEYRLNYFNKMIFQIDLNSDIDIYNIPKLNYTDNIESAFIPNNIIKTKFSFDYKFLGLFISVSPDFLSGNNVDSPYGKTKILDLSFKFFYTDRLRQEVVFKSIKGFYLDDPEKEDPIEVFNDMEINTIGGKTFYIINRNFSYRAFESLTERQIKSDGSFIPSIAYYQNRLNVNKVNNSETYLSSIKSLDVFVQLGYMHNFVIYKKWFSTLGAHPGVGFNNSIDSFVNPADNSNIQNKTANINFVLESNFAVGYNNKNFFTGIRTNYRNLDFDSRTEIASTKLSFGVFAGYRFDENKTVKKGFEYIEKHLGIK
ncbi:DUF4421 family protein [Flavobacterium sp.]|uniref:DUF4421 family protein n=1 Tax=Flavobacterium sp. TaxID=239 RepID=UPI003752D832